MKPNLEVVFSMVTDSPRAQNVNGSCSFREGLSLDSGQGRGRFWRFFVIEALDRYLILLSVRGMQTAQSRLLLNDLADK